MKKFLISGLIAVMVLAAVALAIRLFSGSEDTWICSGGQWIRHGRPAGPMPEKGCPPAEPIAAEEETGPAVPATLPPEKNFFEMGLLSRAKPGEKAGAWSFKYEKLGAALQEVSLVFNQDSVCKIKGQPAACSGFDTVIGVRTRIEGYLLEPPFVLVRNLLAPPR